MIYISIAPNMLFFIIKIIVLRKKLFFTEISDTDIQNSLLLFALQLNYISGLLRIITR